MDHNSKCIYIYIHSHIVIHTCIYYVQLLLLRHPQISSFWNLQSVVCQRTYFCSFWKLNSTGLSGKIPPVSLIHELLFVSESDVFVNLFKFHESNPNHAEKKEKGRVVMMIIIFTTWNSEWIPLIHGLWSWNPYRFDFSVFGGIEPTT